MYRIYIAEDSPLVSYFLRRLLDEAPDLTVVGVGRNGHQAMAEMEALRPDILVTDLIMPEMDGYDLIRWVMATRPIPILVLSDTITSRESDNVMRCLELGAMEVRTKPKLDSRAGSAVAREAFTGLLRALANVKPIGRGPKPPMNHLPAPMPAGQRPEQVLIGASTGGPQAVLAILTQLGPGFPLPVLLALHMEQGFMEGLGRWLRDATGWKVNALATGAAARPGTLYLPPEGRHLILDARGGVASAAPAPAEPLVPSVDRLFLSAVPFAPRTAALLLTGMGRDGAVGLRALREAGGMTFAQNEASCVVYGMPKAAAELQAAGAILDPDGMVVQLRALAANLGRI